MIRIVIVARRHRHGLVRRLLAAQPALELVGQSERVEALPELCRLRRPDAALVEVAELTRPLVHLLSRVTSAARAPELVLRYAAATEPALAAARRAGITVLDPGGELAAALAALARRVRPQPRWRPDGTALTEADLRLISLLSSGRSVPEMAALLRISRHTVENRKRRLYVKLGVGSASHAVAVASSLGLVPEVSPAGADPARSADSAPSPDNTPSTPRPDSAPSPDHDRSADHAGRAADSARRRAPPQPPLAVVHGAIGPGLDTVLLALISARRPFVQLRSAVLPPQPNLRTWPGQLLVVLIDPAPADWQLPGSLDAWVVVVRTEGPEPGRTAEALAPGARAVLPLRDVSAHLPAVLDLVSHGYLAVEAAGHPGLSDLPGLRHRGDAGAGAPVLTTREHQILTEISAGSTVPQAARALGIAPKTVENTLARLYRKLGVRNRAGALIVAYQSGLLEPQAEPDRRDH